MSEEVEIVGLGHSGHGVTAGGLFVPYAAPGDLVRIGEGDGKRASLQEILRAGPSRRSALCGHFARCGGCALQHIAPEDYLAWKREQVANALSQRGFSDVPIDAIRSVKPGTRRRASLKALKSGRTLLLGFYEAGSHRIVDLGECPVLAPALANLLPGLRERLGGLLGSGESAELHLTATEEGVDLSLRWSHARGPDVLMDLASVAQGLDLARLSWNGELVALARTPSLSIGGHRVALPPEPFLQPTREGEKMLQDLVREAVQGARKLADLFAGCGTFSLALAGPGRAVHAVDSSGPMIAALGAASTPVTTEARDLFRRPLMSAELERFDAVVIDPPRPGASAQVGQLAASRVGRIAYVSCNPASFSRDARILVNGGYRLARVSPVDQFLWSPHVELVGVFARGPT